MDEAVVPASVIIPTIGRPTQLEACLTSLAQCRPRAAETLVVDQSHENAVKRVIETFEAAGVRGISCRGLGAARARNVGLGHAAYEIVLFTDDDCTVSPSWVESAWKSMLKEPTSVVTGRVLPAGDARAVPSTIDQSSPRDYSGQVHHVAVYSGNMVCNRSAVLAVGAFDERIAPASDFDFSYRWLRAGFPMRFEPDLVVWHHDWRTHEELEQLYVDYARGMGMVYAKHLRGGDLTMIRFLLRDLRDGLRGLVDGLLRREPRWADWRQGILRGLPIGFRDGWRRFTREG